MFLNPTSSDSTSFHPLYQQGEYMPSTRASPILVYLVGPPIECWGLERLVESAHPRFEVAGTAAYVAESLASLERRAPDVVVLDLEDEVAQSVRTLQDCTSAKLLVLTGSSDLDMLDHAVMAGVRGVIRKSDPPSLLLKAIEKVHEGELWIDRGATRRILSTMARQKAATANHPENSKIAKLTARERQTIAAFTSDPSVPAKVIADRLFISGATLRNHLTSIYAKLGLGNRLGLYDFAARHSLNEPG